MAEAQILEGAEFEAKRVSKSPEVLSANPEVRDLDASDLAPHYNHLPGRRSVPLQIRREVETRRIALFTAPGTMKGNEGDVAPIA